jgi:hypothetical protein
MRRAWNPKGQLLFVPVAFDAVVPLAVSFVAARLAICL